MKPAGNHSIVEFSGCLETALLNTDALGSMLAASIVNSGLTLVTVDAHSFKPHGTTVFALINESHVVLHVYPEANHVSLDIFTCSAEQAPIEKLVTAVANFLHPTVTRRAELKRGAVLEYSRPNWIQLHAADGLEIGIEIDQVLFRKRSEFQLIEVLSSIQFGRILLLDGHLQLSERDALLYSKTILEPILTQARHPDELLILGGGDGSVANYLLKNSDLVPSVVDIDPVVTSACSEFFPELCSLPNSLNVMFNEVLDWLGQSRIYPAIVCDLTLHPESFTRLPRWEYLDLLLRRISNTLAPGGTVVFQCASELDKNTLSNLEPLLREYFVDLRFYSAFIPSLFRNWVFATARR